MLMLSGLLVTCNTSQNNKEAKDELVWATRMADAVMHASDSLIYYQRDNPKYEYDFAFLASAIDRLGEENKKYSDYARAYIDYFVREDGSIKGYKYSDFNIDRVRPGLNILTLYQGTGETKYRVAADTLASQMKEHPRTKSNGYWHKKIYPWQMWLDGIYMAHPFLTAYAKEFNQPEWYDEVAFQIKLIYEKTRDPETGLLYHGWDESREQKWCNPETGQSKHFWSRGMGWYVMALVDVLENFPEEHPDRNTIINILNETCDALLKVRDKQTGLWYQVLDMGGKEGNYIEGSGSAMYTYTFAKGAKLGYLPENYLKIADDSFSSMLDVLVDVDNDGFPVLTNVCGAAGLGGNPYRMGDYDYYINEKKVNNDRKGVAPFILAAIELGR
jgi:unsaturated rhamnogalacturonyl hydrolase